MFLKPATPGLIVRDPISLLPLPEDGAEKPAASYWVRRLLDGDVVEVEAPAPDANRVEDEPTPAATRRPGRSTSPATE